MYILDTKGIVGLNSLSDIPDGEVVEFLREWLNDKSYVIGHTSGSTGKPKKVFLNKEDMRASARMTNEFFGIGRDSVLLLCLSVSYIAGKMMVVRALEAGAVLWIVKVCAHPLSELDAWDEKQINLAAMVPMQVEATLRNAGEKNLLGGIRQLLVGGAPVSELLEKQLKDLPTHAYATYGMTETVSHVALRRIGKDKSYFALGNVAFEQDERGCLVITAPYLQEKRFITNDVVELKDECHFSWLGRWDHVIISGGLKFFPEVIEQKINAFFRERFFITSKPDERLGEKMVLVIEGKLAMSEELLREKLRNVLDVYEMPREIVCIPSFRETETGKVIRRLE